MRSRTISVLGAGLVLATAAACSSSGAADDRSGTASGPAPSTAGSSVTVAPAGTSSAPKSPAYPTASSTTAPGVLRGGSTGDRKIDVLVNVEYRDKAVHPAAGTVTVPAGQRVKVHVTSDSHQDIVVAGHPDKTSDVDPGDPEGVDFVLREKGSVAVSLKQADERLVTFAVQ